MGLATAILRGARFRCPSCGEGEYRPMRLRAADACPECERPYLSDPGDWTGAAEIVLILVLATGVLTFSLAPRAGLQGWPRYGAAIAAALLALLLIYPRIRGAWIGLVHWWEGPEPREWPDDYEAGWPGDDAP